MSAPVRQVDIIEQLKKFAELRDMGILTEEEFQAQKAIIARSVFGPILLL